MSLIAAVGLNGFALPVFHLGTAQDLVYNATGGAQATSAAFQKSGTAITEAIMISVPTNATSGNIRVSIGNPPPAAGPGTPLLIAPGVYIFHVNPGDKLAAIANDAGTGSITITELLSLPPHGPGT